MLTLVTAIYGYGHSSIYGGRGYNADTYRSSLRNIANLNLPIVIFTELSNVELTERYVKPFFKDYKIIPFELNQYEYHDEIINHKRTFIDKIALNNRNEVLCHLKLYWLKNAKDNNYFNSDNYFWIDAGLFHHGIFPEKVGGVELGIVPNDLHYYPTNPNNIFTPTLGEKLQQCIQPDKVFSLITEWHGDISFLQNLIKVEYKKDINLFRHMVAGMFGGSKDTIEQFFQLYRPNLKLVTIDYKHNVLEEYIYSLVLAMHPELFDTRYFHTFHFYSPGERCSYLDKEGNSFYKIFTNILNG